MTATAEVLQLPEGSILVLRDVDLCEVVGARMIDQLAEVVGHRRFLVVQLPSGAGVEVWGPDDDLAAKVQGLLQRQEGSPIHQPQRTDCPWCGAPFVAGPDGYLTIPMEVGGAGDGTELHCCAGGVIVVPG